MTLHAPWAAIPAPDPAAVAAAPPAVAALFGPAAARFGGVIAATRGLHPHRAIPAILSMYPAARVVVATRNRDAVREWVDRLRRAGLPQPVGTVRSLMGRWTAEPKILVASLDNLGHCQREDFDLVVVPDARPLLGVMPARGAGQVGTAADPRLRPAPAVGRAGLRVCAAGYRI